MTTALPDPDDHLSPVLLAEIERNAVDLARLAGTEIQSALGRTMTVRYKEVGDTDALFRDPVSEVDHRVEILIRARLDELFPTHGIIGEELDEKPGDADAIVWAVDPVDGTTNFVNGFPLFAACVGVLHRGRPVAGAIWCSVTHALRPGVYHARDGEPLCFENEPLRRDLNPAVRRRLVGQPHAPEVHDPRWDVRKTGSAAIECAFVAAGLLHAARFEAPNVWDVAGGIALVQAAGGAALVRTADGCRAFRDFNGEDGRGTPRSWREPIAIGDENAAAELLG